MAKSQKIRLYYGIFLTVLAAIVGVSFIIAVSQVYYGGTAEGLDSPFELSRIKDHILVPFILLLCFIAAIIGGFVLSVVFPTAAKKPTYKENGKNLERLKARIPSAGDEEYTAAKRNLSNCETIRKCIWGVSLAVFLIAAIVIFVYAFNATHYHADALKSDALKMVRTVLVCTLIGVVVGIAAVIADEILIRRALKEATTAFVKGDKDAPPAVKEIKKKTVVAGSVAASVIAGIAILAYVLAPILSKSAFSLTQTGIYALVFVFAALIAASFAVYAVLKRYIPEKVNGILLWTTRIAVGVIAVTFIIVGAVNGGANDVLIKAINICTECIGLG